MPGSDDCAIPRAQCDVLTIGKTIAAGSIADTLLTLLKFFEESEVARDCRQRTKQRRKRRETRMNKDKESEKWSNVGSCSIRNLFS